MEERFPGIDWFCDNCDSNLNKQKGFDDRKYIWKCKKCGYKNSISAANIRYKDPVIHNITGFLLGFSRSLLVYVLVISCYAELICSQQPTVLFGYNLLHLCAIAYSLIMIVSLFFERAIAKYGIHQPLGKWIISGIPIHIWGDVFRPVREVLGYPFALLNLIRLKVQGITAKKYFRQKCIYATAYLLLLLVALLILQKYDLVQWPTVSFR